MGIIGHDYGRLRGTFPETAEVRPIRRLGFREYGRLLREYGGRTERLSYALCWLLFAVMVGPLGILFWAFWVDMLPFEWLFTSFLAAATVGAYYMIVAATSFNAAMFAAMLSEGRLPGYEERAREWIRYVEAHGRDGQLPGAFRWTAAAFAVYVAMMGAPSWSPLHSTCPWARHPLCLRGS